MARAAKPKKEISMEEALWKSADKYIFTSNLHQMMLKLMQRRKNRSFGLNSPVPAI